MVRMWYQTELDVTRLDDAAFAAHVIGHLASTVVRAEVRAVNVLDVWFLHEQGLDWTAVATVMLACSPAAFAGGLRIHAVVDNYSTHKHPKVRRWLARHRSGQGAG